MIGDARIFAMVIGAAMLHPGMMIEDVPRIRSGPLPRRRARRVEAPAPPQGPETRQQRRHRERQAAKVQS